MNERWKVYSGEINLRQSDPSEIHETSSLSYYRNDYYKVQQRTAAFVRTIFCRSCRVRFCHLIQFNNCDVALRPRFHAYTSLVCITVKGLYQNKVNSNLVSTRCKMDYVVTGNESNKVFRRGYKMEQTPHSSET